MAACFAGPRAWLIATILLVTGVATGCQPSAEQLVKDAFRREFRENGRRVVFFYARFMSSPAKPVGPNGFSGPKDEADLRKFIAASPPAALEEMGIQDADAAELFTSERDGQPFRIRYGIRGALGTTYAVVCEAKGVNGRVKVFKTDGSFVEVAADEAEAYMAGERDAPYDPGSGI